MNISNSDGESSCKGQENGDVSTESERPLKKARFAWQVKGKYHLKNDVSLTAQTSSTSAPDSERKECVSKNKSNIKDCKTDQKLEILGDYILKDCNTINTSDANKFCSSNTIKEPLQYPRYVSSSNNGSSTGYSLLGNVNSRQYNKVSTSMVSSHNYDEDQCIARWQSTQMAKVFVDNTMNHVIDSWLASHLPQDAQSNRLFGVADFLNNMPGDNTVENEGILMAISAHGLQNTSGTSSNIDSCSIDHNCGASSSKDDVSSHRSSPIPSDDDSVSETINEKKDLNEGNSRNEETSWTYTEDIESNANLEYAPFNFFPDSSNSSYQAFSGNYNNVDETVSSGPNEFITSHYDFLDAAVSFAIQNKGLTSFGTEYG